ncbi:MAG: glycosyltransferase family 4 protein, partial [Bacteroidales bacterium]|nr:glycosyltransferase family 4 protein [Bacteroidales bacterium]
YSGERWIYKKADAVVMTWPGGKDYILEQGWDNVVNMDKVHHISNGVVIDSFDENAEKYPVSDPDLSSQKHFNVVYAGSIRKVNNLGVLLDAAKIVATEGYDDIRFLIYGSGNEESSLRQRCNEKNITNVIFKGRVDKQSVPSVLQQANINILHNSSTSLDKYGQSQNKLFEYLAAGKCIVQTYTTGHSVLDKYNAGISVENQNPDSIAKTIIDVYNNQADLKIRGSNARNASKDFDFKKLTSKLIAIIENLD